MPFRAQSILSTADTGLICAFELGGSAPIMPIDWATIDAGPAPEGRFYWIHLNLTTEPARTWLRDSSGLDEELVEILLDPEPRTMAEPWDAGLVLTIKDVLFELGGEAREVDFLRVWAEQGRVITLRRRPLQSTNRTRRLLPEDDDRPVSEAEFITWLLEQITNDLERVVEQLAKDSDDAEDELLTNDTMSLRKHLGVLRRDAVQLRRAANPARQSLRRLVSGRLPQWFDAEDREDLRDGVEQMSSVIDELEGVIERAKLLQEEFAAKLSEETNHNLYILSVVSAVMLPMTLVTGIFGMNVGGLPGVDSPHGFFMTMVLIIGIGVGTLLLLKRKRLL